MILQSAFSQSNVDNDLESLQQMLPRGYHGKLLAKQWQQKSKHRHRDRRGSGNTESDSDSEQVQDQNAHSDYDSDNHNESNIASNSDSIRPHPKALINLAAVRQQTSKYSNNNANSDSGSSDTENDNLRRLKDEFNGLLESVQNQSDSKTRQRQDVGDDYEGENFGDQYRESDEQYDSYNDSNSNESDDYDSESESKQSQYHKNDPIKPLPSYRNAKKHKSMVEISKESDFKKNDVQESWDDESEFYPESQSGESEEDDDIDESNPDVRRKYAKTPFNQVNQITKSEDKDSNRDDLESELSDSQPDSSSDSKRTKSSNGKSENSDLRHLIQTLASEVSGLKQQLNKKQEIQTNHPENSDDDYKSDSVSNDNEEYMISKHAPSHESKSNSESKKKHDVYLYRKKHHDRHDENFDSNNDSQDHSMLDSNNSETTTETKDDSKSDNETSESDSDQHSENNDLELIRDSSSQYPTWSSSRIHEQNLFELSDSPFFSSSSSRNDKNAGCVEAQTQSKSQRRLKSDSLKSNLKSRFIGCYRSPDSNIATDPNINFQVLKSTHIHRQSRRMAKKTCQSTCSQKRNINKLASESGTGGPGIESVIIHTRYFGLKMLPNDNRFKTNTNSQQKRRKDSDSATSIADSIMEMMQIDRKDLNSEANFKSRRRTKPVKKIHWKHTINAPIQTQNSAVVLPRLEKKIIYHRLSPRVRPKSSFIQTNQAQIQNGNNDLESELEEDSATDQDRLRAHSNEALSEFVNDDSDNDSQSDSVESESESDEQDAEDDHTEDDEESNVENSNVNDATEPYESDDVSYEPHKHTNDNQILMISESSYRKMDFVCECFNQLDEHEIILEPQVTNIDSVSGRSDIINFKSSDTQESCPTEIKSHSFIHSSKKNIPVSIVHEFEQCGRLKSLSWSSDDSDSKLLSDDIRYEVKSNLINSMKNQFVKSLANLSGQFGRKNLNTKQSKLSQDGTDCTCKGPYTCNNPNFSVCIQYSPYEARCRSADSEGSPKLQPISYRVNLHQNLNVNKESDSTSDSESDSDQQDSDNDDSSNSDSQNLPIFPRPWSNAYIFPDASCEWSQSKTYLLGGDTGSSSSSDEQYYGCDCEGQSLSKCTIQKFSSDEQIDPDYHSIPDPPKMYCAQQIQNSQDSENSNNIFQCLPVDDWLREEVLKSPVPGRLHQEERGEGHLLEGVSFSQPWEEGSCNVRSDGHESNHQNRQKSRFRKKNLKSKKKFSKKGQQQLRKTRYSKSQNSRLMRVKNRHYHSNADDDDDESNSFVHSPTDQKFHGHQHISTFNANTNNLIDNDQDLILPSWYPNRPSSTIGNVTAYIHPHNIILPLQLRLLVPSCFDAAKIRYYLASNLSNLFQRLLKLFQNQQGGKITLTECETCPSVGSSITDDSCEFTDEIQQGEIEVNNIGQNSNSESQLANSEDSDNTDNINLHHWHHHQDQQFHSLPRYHRSSVQMHRNSNHHVNLQTETQRHSKKSNRNHHRRQISNHHRNRNHHNHHSAESVHDNDHHAPYSNFHSLFNSNSKQYQDNADLRDQAWNEFQKNRILDTDSNNNSPIDKMVAQKIKQQMQLINLNQKQLAINSHKQHKLRKNHNGNQRRRRKRSNLGRSRKKNLNRKHHTRRAVQSFIQEPESDNDSITADMIQKLAKKITSMQNPSHNDTVQEQNQLLNLIQSKSNAGSALVSQTNQDSKTSKSESFDKSSEQHQLLQELLDKRNQLKSALRESIRDKKDRLRKLTEIEATQLSTGNVNSEPDSESISSFIQLESHYKDEDEILRRADNLQDTRMSDFLKHVVQQQEFRLSARSDLDNINSGSNTITTTTNSSGQQFQVDSGPGSDSFLQKSGSSQTGNTPSTQIQIQTLASSPNNINSNHQQLNLAELYSKEHKRSLNHPNGYYRNNKNLDMKNQNLQQPIKTSEQLKQYQVQQYQIPSAGPQSFLESSGRNPQNHATFNSGFDSGYEAGLAQAQANSLKFNNNYMHNDMNDNMFEQQFKYDSGNGYGTSYTSTSTIGPSPHPRVWRNVAVYFAIFFNTQQARDSAVTTCQVSDQSDSSESDTDSESQTNSESDSDVNTDDSSQSSNDTVYSKFLTNLGDLMVRDRVEITRILNGIDQLSAEKNLIESNLNCSATTRIPRSISSFGGGYGGEPYNTSVTNNDGTATTTGTTSTVTVTPSGPGSGNSDSVASNRKMDINLEWVPKMVRDYRACGAEPGSVSFCSFDSDQVVFHMHRELPNVNETNRNSASSDNNQASSNDDSDNDNQGNANF